MNTPNPASSPSGTVAVPAATPTIGALIGSVIAAAVVPHVGADAVAQYAVSTVIPTFFTWLFHFVHSKLGTPE